MQAFPQAEEMGLNVICKGSFCNFSQAGVAQLIPGYVQDMTHVLQINRFRIILNPTEFEIGHFWKSIDF